MISAEEAVWVLVKQAKGQYKETASWTNQTEFTPMKNTPKYEYIHDKSLDKKTPNNPKQ
jgi:hypothetical protein